MACARNMVEACGGTALNAVFALGRPALSALRARVSAMLTAGAPESVRARQDLGLLVPMADVDLLVPAQVGDYTDFYASIDHATNVGSMFRPDNPLLPNYRHVPIGYHGRASSIVASGTPVRRPHGQTVAAPAGPPDVRAEQADGLRAGGRGVHRRGQPPWARPVPLAEAESHIAGLVLVNDWSARDLQTWEYQPLGPFLAKNFATTVSPWVVTLDALEPFRVPARAPRRGRAGALPYLTDSRGQRAPAASRSRSRSWLRTARMRDAGAPAERLSRGSFAADVLDVAQMVTHHASNGCNLRPGDLHRERHGVRAHTRGARLPAGVSWRGTEPVLLPNGEQRVPRGWGRGDPPGLVRTSRSGESWVRGMPRDPAASEGGDANCAMQT
jgi:fumarylacetoacetase